MAVDEARILFIINPRSGGAGSVGAVLKKVTSKYPSARLVLSEYKGHISKLVNDNLDRTDVFIAVGGDGTINEMAASLVGSDKLMAALPLGSGNGFALEFGFTRSIESIMRGIKKNDFLEVDVLKLNDKYCVNVAGNGIDSVVADAFAGGNQRGIKGYVKYFLKSEDKFKSFEVEVRNAEGEVLYKDKNLMLAVANGSQYGNHAFVAPNANPTDQMFSLVLLKDIPIIQLPFYVTMMFTKGLRTDRNIRYINLSEPVTINSSQKIWQIDGEVEIFEGKVEVSMLPKALKVVRTSKCKYK
ncbi:MAG: diacylglycerol/lipid kinase family protein [Bacteroidales bacterium]